MAKQGFSWMNDSLESRKTEKYGNGVFAKESIKKGTLLLVFGGHVLTRKEEVQLPSRIVDIAIQIERDKVIGVVNDQELGQADYVNHSCDPNSGIKGQISLVAMRDINTDEEITFDYGTVLYRAASAPEYELRCECGSINCRGKITQFDWRSPALQERYRGYWPYYLQEEIDGLIK